MTEKEYIALCVEKAVSEAKDVIANYLQPFDRIIADFSTLNMSRKDFNKILKEMKC